MRRLIDTNVWLALSLEKHSFNSLAEEWISGLAENDELLFCRSTQQSFLRLLTNASVMQRYDVPVVSNASAWAAFDRWLARPGVSIAREPAGLDDVWRILSSRSASSPQPHT